MRLTSLTLSTLLLSLTACTTYEPIIDTSHPTFPLSSNYQTDLKQCQDFSTQHSPTQNILIGAVLTSVVTYTVASLTLPAAALLPVTKAAFITGGLSGFGTFNPVGGAGSSITTTKSIISTCLRNRGYSVLN